MKIGRGYAAYLVIAWIALCAVPLAAQTAQITGRVVDATEASVPGADVNVMNAATGVQRNYQTNEAGYYTAPFLQPGSYNVSVTAAGFRSVLRENVMLEVDQTGRVDFKLEVGQVTESITITSDAPLLQSESAAIGQVIGNRQIVDLPLNGRSFLQLAVLTPGARTSAQAVLGKASLEINGNRGSKTGFTIDGVSSVEQQYDGVVLTPSVDAIAEFKVQSNALSAEFGQGGAAVSLELKSGTNEIHGSVFEFLRNDVFDARDFFNQTGTSNSLRQNQFGFGVGAPIVKNNTFIFGDYQGTRIRNGRTINVVAVPEAARRGDFSAEGDILDPLNGRQPFANRQIPAARLSKQTGYFFDFMPTPNTAQGTYNRVASDSDDTDQFDVRVDQNFSAKDLLNGSYSYQYNDAVTPGPYPENGGTMITQLNQRAGLAYVHTFSASIFNEFRLGYVRTGFERL